MSDASIPLGFRPAQIQEPDFVGAVGRGMSLQQMAQTSQLNDARIKEERLKAQALDEDRRDQGTIQQAYSKYPGDMKKVREVIAPQVNQRALQAFDKSVQEHAAALSKMDLDKITVARETSEQLARHLDAVSNVKRGDNSPEAVAARAAEWAKQVTLAKSKGLDAQNQLTTQYPGDEALPVLDTQLRGSAKHLADEEARRKTEESALNVQKKQHEVDADRRSEAAGILAAAAQRSAADYIHARASLDPKLQPMFPDIPEDAQPVGGLPDEFIENVQNIGMKPHEQATTALTKEQRRIQAEQAETNAGYREKMADVAADRAGTYNWLASIRQELADLKEKTGPNGQTANSQAVDKRQARNEYYKVVAAEQKLNRLRIALGPLVEKQAGGEKVLNKDGTERNAREEFDLATDELQQVIADKYDAADRAGMGKPSVSLEDATKAIREGSTPKTSTPAKPAAAAPAPKTAPAPAAAPKPKAETPAQAKVFPRAKLAAFARANSMAPEKAEAELKAQGYTVQ